MSDPDPITVSAETLEILRTAHTAYAAEVAPSYDELLHEVVGRVTRTGSLGKLDIGGLVLWKRLQANTPWVTRLHGWSEQDVRAVTATAVLAVRDDRMSVSDAAAAGRAALTPLPGFDRGDALASAVLTAAAPDRMAVYDLRAQTALERLGYTVSSARGRYGRYMKLVQVLTSVANNDGLGWRPRDVDVALFWLGGRSRSA
jgi:hypothetical protein